MKAESVTVWVLAEGGSCRGEGELPDLPLRPYRQYHPGETGFPVRVYRATRWCPGEGFLGHALRPDPVDFDHAKTEGKRRAGRKRSGRCPTDYREGWLQRGGGAGLSKGKPHLHVLGEIRKVAM